MFGLQDLLRLNHIMKILYGVQSTGNGHICRSREIIGGLKIRGHDVHVIFSGRAPNLLWEIKICKPYITYRGLTFITTQGKIKYLKTAFHLNPIQFYRDILLYDASGFDLVITDFEPISARIAKYHSIPSIGIGSQYSFFYNIPIAKGKLLGRFILKNFAPADYRVGLHWHHFDQPILPPIVPNHLKNDRHIIVNKILVYLPFEDKDEIKLILQDIKTHHFYIYNNSCKHPSDEANLHYRSYSRRNFLYDLAECNGVICNAGFELPSEALHLGKKILVKPLVGQMEQESNALALSQLNLGMTSRKLNRDLIKDWLYSSSNSPMNYPNVSENIVEWIDSGCWNNLANLAQHIWNKN